VVAPGVVAARPGERCRRPRGYCSRHLQTRRVLHGQRDIGQALEPERLESMQLVARDQVGPIDLRRGNEFPPLGRESLTGEDLPEALPHDDCGRADAGAAEPPRRPRRGVGDPEPHVPGSQ
jgi:hypothetical protein